MSGHTCHAIACAIPVPPSRFMCGKHWSLLPKPLRDAIWRHYRTGQERDKQPSSDYLAVAGSAIHWLHEHEGIRGGLRCLVCVELQAAAPATEEHDG